DKLAASDYKAGEIKEIVWDIEPFLAGVISEDQLMQSATNSVWSLDIQKQQLCEACYYAGMKDLTEGNTLGAISLFHKGTDSVKIQFGHPYFHEYVDAKLEL